MLIVGTFGAGGGGGMGGDTQTPTGAEVVVRPLLAVTVTVTWLVAYAVLNVMLAEPEYGVPAGVEAGRFVEPLAPPAPQSPDT